MQRLLFAQVNIYNRALLFEYQKLLLFGRIICH